MHGNTYVTSRVGTKLATDVQKGEPAFSLGFILLHSLLHIAPRVHIVNQENLLICDANVGFSFIAFLADP